MVHTSGLQIQVYTWELGEAFTKLDGFYNLMTTAERPHKHTHTHTHINSYTHSHSLLHQISEVFRSQY